MIEDKIYKIKPQNTINNIVFKIFSIKNLQANHIKNQFNLIEHLKEMLYSTYLNLRLNRMQWLNIFSTVTLGNYHHHIYFFDITIKNNVSYVLEYIGLFSF